MRIVLALALFLQAANGRQVAIAVKDPQGLTGEDERVTVNKQRGTTRRSAVTTSDGARVEGLAPGVYAVRVEATGFATKTVTADLRTQNSATVTVDLPL